MMQNMRLKLNSWIIGSVESIWASLSSSLNFEIQCMHQLAGGYVNTSVRWWIIEKSSYCVCKKLCITGHKQTAAVFACGWYGMWGTLFLLFHIYFFLSFSTFISLVGNTGRDLQHLISYWMSLFHIWKISIQLPEKFTPKGFHTFLTCCSYEAMTWSWVMLASRVQHMEIL